MQLNTERIQEKVLEFLEKELGETWDQLSDAQKDLTTKAITAYAESQIKLLAANIFKDIDEDQVKGNIKHILSGLVNLGASFEAVVAQAIDRAVRRALTEALMSIGGPVEEAPKT